MLSGGQFVPLIDGHIAEIEPCLDILGVALNDSLKIAIRVIEFPDEDEDGGDGGFTCAKGIVHTAVSAPKAAGVVIAVYLLCNLL